MDVAPDPLIGQVLEERYRVEALLGAGGMGRVYRAQHVRRGRACAVKVLGREASLDESAVRRFEREARVLGRLGHPGIVGVAVYWVIAKPSDPGLKRMGALGMDAAPPP